jgi:hypothetical protein
MMTSPADLARELGIGAHELRTWLRANYPRLERGKRWELSTDQVDAARMHWATPKSTRKSITSGPGRSRADSDEAYVVDLLDELLGVRAERQHRFAWLLGDPGRRSRQVALPVDAFWADLQLVFEYRERQHSVSTPFFDKPTVMTVSGVDRGEQRRRYDARRDELIPAHGLRLLVVNADQLSCDARGRLRRAYDADRKVLAKLLHEVLVDRVPRNAV